MGNWYVQAAVVYVVMAAGFAISLTAFRMLRPRLRDDARLYRAVALATFSTYYLGVTPEIHEAWHWPLWTVPAMLSLPLAAAVAAVRRQRGDRSLPVLGG